MLKSFYLEANPKKLYIIIFFRNKKREGRFMKKLLHHSLLLLSAFTMLFTMSSANAVLIREEIQLENVLNQKDHTYDWQLEGGRYGHNNEASFVEAVAADLRTDSSLLYEIAYNMRNIQFKKAAIPSCQHKIVPDDWRMCLHKTLPYSWCICAYAPPILRYTIILLQAKSILEKYPPETTPLLVHTSFAEEGLLQTYCLVHTLTNLGYRNIHVNVIGNDILESIGKKLGYTLAPDKKMTEKQKQKIKSVIQAEFMKLFHTEVQIYESVYVYMNEVLQGVAPRSMSFDMIDGGGNLPPIIYSRTKLPVLFQDSSGQPFNETVCDKIEELGTICDYEKAEIFCGIENKGESSPKAYAVCELSILKKTSSKYNLQNMIRTDKVGKFEIEEKDVTEKLLPDQDRMINILRKKLQKPVCIFVLFRHHSNEEIFKELIDKTCVEGKEPIAFELNGNIYTYRQDGPKPVRPAASAAASAAVAAPVAAAM